MNLRTLFILRLALPVILALSATQARAATFEDKFAVVFIDSDTEKKLGGFPLNRSYMAKAVGKAAEAKAKGVVLKFFFDQAKDLADDSALAAALGKLPVLLQARIDDTEPGPNPLPAKFFVKAVTPKVAVAGKSGWLPLPTLAAQARDIGFVDFAKPQELPMLELYQGKPVKALALCCVELALGKNGVIEPGVAIKFGPRTLPLDAKNCVPARLPKADRIDYIPFHAFLEDKSAVAKVTGKVVIIGYDGEKMQSISTPVGPMKAHRFFVQTLKGIYGQLQ